MTEKLYAVRDIKGNVIDSFPTLELAEDALEQKELDELEQCNYVPGYYEIVTLHNTAE